MGSWGHVVRTIPWVSPQTLAGKRELGFYLFSLAHVWDMRITICIPMTRVIRYGHDISLDVIDEENIPDLWDGRTLDSFGPKDRYLLFVAQSYLQTLAAAAIPRSDQDFEFITPPKDPPGQFEFTFSRPGSD